MALLMIDGFDYLTAENAARVSSAYGWVSGSGVLTANDNTAFGYGKSQGMGGGGGNRRTAIRNLRERYTSANMYVMGMRMFVPDASQSQYMGFKDSTVPDNNTQTQFALGFDYNGAITFFRNEYYDVYARTRSGVYQANKWFYLEVKWRPGLAEFFEVRINTVPVMSLTAAPTSRGQFVLPSLLPGFDQFYRGFDATANGSGNWVIDDFYLLDDTGDINNDYLGNVRAMALDPIADGDIIEFAIGGTDPQPSNWQSVLNTQFNDDSYVYGAPVGLRDLYKLNPGTNTPFVHGLEVATAYRQDDATQKAVRNALRQGGVDVFGKTFFINQSYTVYPDIFEINPATGLQFTGAEVNDLQVGPDIVQ